MSKYDTHGGYFAPQDSMRINEGGSHEENPNGGVQIGVDEQGIPNMLEEGEPVYKDFVYSDNIKASEKFLEANSIPVKYKDKLYSEIADAFFEEADERPYDPVSRNGLEAMLGRLANAQEEQKQDKERRSIERELKQLSPEELEALEQEMMAAEQALTEQQLVQEVAPEQMEQPIEQVPMDQVPQEQPVMMADGGPVNKFKDGDKLTKAQQAALEQGVAFDKMKLGNPIMPGMMGWAKKAQATKNVMKALGILAGGHAISEDLLPIVLDDYYATHGTNSAAAFAKDAESTEYNNTQRKPLSPIFPEGIAKSITAGNGLSDAFNPQGLKNGIPINKDHWLHYGKYGTGITDIDIPSIEDVGYSDYNFDDTPQGTIGAAPGYGSYGYGRRAMSSASASSNVPLPDLTDANAAIDASIIRNSGFMEPLPKGPEIKAGAVALNDQSNVAPWKRVEPADNSDDNEPAATGPYFPTFSRYAGAIGSGILGLYNAMQKPDKYTATRLRPYVPTGHINLQNERYMPVDQNMIQNQMLAQGNSTQRALRNSGLGPSAAAAILAADNNTTGNLGTGFLQSWQANNQQRNAVTAANNQAEAQRAQFDYAVDAAKQRALAEAQYRNAYNDLMLQRYNYQAEADKYNAVSNQINAGLEALSGIGRENYIRNQINTNTALNGYRALGNGIGAYIPEYGYIRKCGGKIKK